MSRKPTAAQKAKAEQRRTAFRTLVKKVSAMDETEKSDFLRKFPVVATVEGHTLSPSNVMLVLMQNPRSSIVGGFRQWIRAGRVVRKGEHGIAIWVPTAQANEQDGENPDIHFLMGTVFDVSQTEELNVETQAA